MKKVFTYLFGLLSGVTLCLLFYKYGFEYLSKHFEEVIAIYIVFGLLCTILLIFIYSKAEKLIKKFETLTDESNAESLTKALNEKKWGIAILSIKGDLAMALAKFSVSNWIFKTFQIVILGFVGIFGSMLVYNQNKLFEHQNHRLDQQTYLQEAERRSSLIFLFSNILDKIDDELKTETNQERELSNQLIGRIIALSEAFKPYKYLEQDSLIQGDLSPERGQLLLALVNSEISDESFNKIIAKANLSYADLRGAELNNINLSNGRLERANFEDASLIDANFSGAFLKESNFHNANCRLINFTAAYLYKSDLRKANLNIADLRYVPEDGIFEGPQMDTDITLAKVDRKDWIEFHKRYMVKGMQSLEKVFKVDTTLRKDDNGKPYYRMENMSEYYQNE